MVPLSFVPPTVPRKSTSSTPANPNQTRASICSLLVEASEKGFSLDSITLDTVIQSVASAQLRTGDKAAGRSHPKAHQNSRQEGFGWNQGCITESTLQGKIRDPRLAPRATAPPPAHSDHPYAASPLRLPCSPFGPVFFSSHCRGRANDSSWPSGSGIWKYRSPQEASRGISGSNPVSFR